MGDPYVDAPLSRHEGSQEFRLVELRPSIPSGPIRCTLRTYTFDPHPPAYTALSYTWGPKVKPKNIELNGVFFPVGYSLWSFLEEMRLQGQFRVYWIDAICIDQESVLERNHQVQMMRQIYSNAEAVLVWLGEADRQLTSDIAMDFLSKRSQILEVTTYPWHTNVHYTKAYHDWVTAQTSVGQQTIEFPWSRQQAEAVLKLYNRPYWSRIWIVQEIFLAKTLVVCCGSKQCGWQALKDLDNDLKHVGAKDLQNTILEFNSSKAVKLIRAQALYCSGKRYATLTELLVSFCDLKATNILDKVYGVCGLAMDGTSFTIDYDIHPQDLLTRLMAYTWARMSEQDTQALRDFVIVMSASLSIKWSISKLEVEVGLALACMRTAE